MVYVRLDQARRRGARYPYNAPGIAVRIPSISIIALNPNLPPWPKCTLETCTLETCTLETCTLETCILATCTLETGTLETGTLETGTLETGTLETCTLENCTLENIWPRRTRERRGCPPRLERTLE
jgi:uncharacterized protein YjbI with pentapeptide repeats